MAKDKEGERSLLQRAGETWGKMAGGFERFLEPCARTYAIEVGMDDFRADARAVFKPLDDRELLQGKGRFSSMFDQWAGSERVNRDFCERIKGNGVFVSVLQSFDRVVNDDDEMRNSRFFYHDAIQIDFIKRLEKFDKYVEQKMEVLRAQVREGEGWNKFSPNWEENVKRACYYSFFMHYGAKRGAERGDDDKPLDYVYHPIDAAFDCLASKLMFLDEKTILATILHDTGEDWDRGIFGLLNVGNEEDFDTLAKGKKISLYGREGRAKKGKVMTSAVKVRDFMNGFMEDLDDSSGGHDPETELSVRELVELVTKKTNDRNEAIMEMFETISKIENPQKKLCAMKAFMIKLADRISNIKTNKSQVSGRSANPNQIEDETIYLYLELCWEFGMINAADWLLDYIKLPDYDRRRKAIKTGVAAERSESGLADGKGSNETLKDHFRAYFQQKLSEDVGEKMEEGRDYIIAFRPVGLRHSLELADQEARRKSFSTGLRNYVIIYPITDDDGLNGRIASGAKALMAGLFEHGKFARGPRAPIMDCALGQRILEGMGENSGVGYCPANDDCPEWGDSIWHVYDSREEAQRSLLGDVHTAFFQKGEVKRAAAGKILKVLDGVARDGRGVLNNYKDLRGQWEKENEEIGGASVSSIERTALRNLEKFIALYPLTIFTKRSHRIMAQTREVGTPYMEVCDVFVDNPGETLMCAFYREPRLVFKKFVTTVCRGDPSVDPPIEAFLDFCVIEDLLEKRNYREFNDQVLKALRLLGNYRDKIFDDGPDNLRVAA